MIKSITTVKAQARQRRRKAIRKRMHGDMNRPRLVVFRSLKHIYAQIVDDDQGRILVSMSTRAKDYQPPAAPEKKKKKAPSRRVSESFQVGLMLGEKAKAAGIETVCFDRAGYKFHGRVKALAEGTRKAGLSF
ncbi:MAG: 50S ribosomal protein L18 [Candidatus Cloacimonetes bacterium]|nr:50S ribosomal protein L18 [Candidatus Cloacimonadota bacterium]